MAVLVTLGLLITLLVVMVIPSIAAEADKTLELIRTHDPGEGHVPLIPHSWMEYLESNVNFAQIKHRQMSASFPLSVENNRVCAGYLPLVPVTPQSRYRAFLLLTLPQ